MIMTFWRWGGGGREDKGHVFRHALFELSNSGFLHSPSLDPKQLLKCTHSMISYCRVLGKPGMDHVSTECRAMF